MPEHQPTRRRLRVRGIVQGVGYRPFVHTLAGELGLTGHVHNDAGGVVVEVEGSSSAVDDLARRLHDDAPALAIVDDVTVEAELPATRSPGFTIRPSAADGPTTTAVAPDTATCPACLAELDDPDDRRFRHPLINCTDCGPRYSIVRDLPYDRATTSMSGFAMCPACAAEYVDPTDRRFHAQPVCCHDCGPRVTLALLGEVAASPADPSTGPPDAAAIRAAADLLCDGRVLAVKGVGGYHLAALATDENAVRRLRHAKHREERPFAMMVADLAAAQRLAEIDAAAADLLSSPARPIVLVPRRGDADVAASVAPATRRLGLMLPYTGLHRLLLAEVGAPIVLTSGNRADEPIAHDDADARERLGPMVDALLGHDRPIQTRVDDSVATTIDGAPVVLRRSRGYAPAPIVLTAALRRPVLAVGGQLKNTVCLARDDRAFVSQHLGDLDHWTAQQAFRDTIEHLARLFDVRPGVVAHDLHPEYASTTHALELGLPTIGVQHHHAHIAACLADNRRDGPVIGIAFDGTGYGTDGTLWGGEVLHADLTDAVRLGHLAEVPLPGGEAAIRHPWRMAVAHLAAAGLEPPAEFVARHEDQWHAVTSLLSNPGVSPPTTSVGRLFDAAAALVGVRDSVTYEGQAAIELEQLVIPRRDDAPTASQPPRPSVPGLQQEAASAGPVVPFVLPAGPLVERVVTGIAAGLTPSAIATAFHDDVAALIVTAAVRGRELTGLATVALSGGVFQNAVLVARACRRLDAAGFEVLTHRRVPPNDGGISLGQAVVVGARDRR